MFCTHVKDLFIDLELVENEHLQLQKHVLLFLYVFFPSQSYTYTWDAVLVCNRKG